MSPFQTRLPILLALAVSTLAQSRQGASPVPLDLKKILGKGFDAYESVLGKPTKADHRSDKMYGGDPKRPVFMGTSDTETRVYLSKTYGRVEVRHSRETYANGITGGIDAQGESILVRTRYYVNIQFPKLNAARTISQALSRVGMGTFGHMVSVYGDDQVLGWQALRQCESQRLTGGIRFTAKRRSLTFNVGVQEQASEPSSGALDARRIVGRSQADAERALGKPTHVAQFDPPEEAPPGTHFYEVAGVCTAFASPGVIAPFEDGIIEFRFPKERAATAPDAMRLLGLDPATAKEVKDGWTFDALKGWRVEWNGPDPLEKKEGVNRLTFLKNVSREVKPPTVAKAAATPKDERADGPSVLSGDPVLRLANGAKARLDSSGGVHTVTIAKPGRAPWDVRLSWPIAGDVARQVGGKRVRLEFSAQASRDLAVPMQGVWGNNPEEMVGTSQSLDLTTEWRRFAFDFKMESDTGVPVDLPSFALSSAPGSVSVRGVSLKRLERPIPPAKPIRTVGGIFRWHESLPERFSAGQLGDIVGAWATEYADTFVNAGGKVTKDWDSAVSTMREQIEYKGQFTNGPGEVLVRSLVQTGAMVVVKGFWRGSWRVFSQGQIIGSDLPIEGGESFSGDFTATWKQSGGVWKQTSLVYGAFRRLKPKEEAALVAAHAKLRKRSAGK